MNIILFKGQSQYDALRYFADCLKKTLSYRKHNVFVVDMIKDGWDAKLTEILGQNSINMAIDFNGIASDIKVQNKSIYDVLKIYYLAIYVDHPCYHLQRLCASNMHYIASFIDKSHVDFVQNIIPDSHKIKFFLPHAGSKISKIKNISQYRETKTIDLLFTGSAPSLQEKPWINSSSKIVAEFLDEMTNTFLSNMDLHVKDIFEKINIKYHTLLSPIAKAQNANFLHHLITHIRRQRRTLLLETLAQSGFNITVCGNGWDSWAKKYDNINYIGAVNMEESLKLISQTKILIHNNIDFSRGSHERVFNAMLNNTFVFSDRSEYYDEFFEANEDIIYYKYASLKEDIKKLHIILQDDEKLYQKTKRPKQICEEHHTWNNRVNLIEDIYEYAKLLDQ